MEKRKGILENKTVNIYQHQVIFAREPRFGQHQVISIELLGISFYEF
jgi:hypothetical protein